MKQEGSGTRASAAALTLSMVTYRKHTLSHRLAGLLEDLADRASMERGRLSSGRLPLKSFAALATEIDILTARVNELEDVVAGLTTQGSPEEER